MISNDAKAGHGHMFYRLTLCPCMHMIRPDRHWSIDDMAMGIMIRPDEHWFNLNGTDVIDSIDRK